MKIVITGATGLIGKSLSLSLMKSGHQVIALVRDPNKITFLPPSQVFSTEGDSEKLKSTISGSDAFIHLAGEPVAQRWTVESKKRILDSRTESTKNFVAMMNSLPADQRPKTFICASAIGIYGERGDVLLHEESTRGTGFLADVTDAWEAEAKKAEGTRLVLLRTGVVLSNEGGALEKMKPVILGSGLQWISWIHIDDQVGFIEHAIQNTNVVGAYNLTAPTPVTNKVFSQILADVTNFPVVVPAPALAISVALGEMAEIVLGSQRVLPTRTLESGFQFKFPELREALLNIYDSRNYLHSTFHSAQFVPRPLEEVFSFFSKAENLETLTPAFLNFKIVRKSTPEIQKGTLIDYRLKIHGVPASWRTEICTWEPNVRFVDDQLKGPYSKWHHLHEFFSVPGGTLMTDHVTFQVPGWSLGRGLLGNFIRGDVNQIFKYRTEKIKEIFG